MSQKYLIRIAELENQFRQKDQQLSLVEEMEVFLRSAPALAEEKIEEDGREGDPLVPCQLQQSRHRRPLPEHLPREVKHLEPTENCCPGMWK